MLSQFFHSRRAGLVFSTVLLFCFTVSKNVYAATASVDHMRITVYYTDAAGPAPFFSWWSLPLMLLGCGWVLWKEGYLGGEMIRERT